MCNVFEFANAILVKSDTQIFSQLHALDPLAMSETSSSEVDVTGICL